MLLSDKKDFYNSDFLRTIHVWVSLIVKAKLAYLISYKIVIPEIWCNKNFMLKIIQNFNRFDTTHEAIFELPKFILWQFNVCLKWLIES